jgi:carboxyl-terminal processing protease
MRLLLPLIVFLFASEILWAQKNEDVEEKKRPMGAIAFAKKDNSLECRYLTMIEDGFLRYHVKYTKRDKELENQVIDQHLKKLDSSKIYYTQDDADKVKEMMKGLFEKTKKNDCEFLVEAQNLLVKRIQERAEFAKKFLGKDYKFDDKTEFTFDPDQKKYPKNSDEANDFLKKYIHFQISNYLATDMKLEEAKDRVKKNYDLAIKRLNETSIDDLYSGYLDSFARALDPHSSFFSKDVLSDFQIQMSLSLEGIGATLSSENGFTVVEQLVPGGAAARSGLVEPQDKIVAVGQEKGEMENVIDMDLKDVVKKIRGAKNTKVRLTVLRKTGDGKSRKDITLTRDKVSLEDEAANIHFIDREVNGAKKKLGIVNLPSFYADSKSGGRSAATDLKKLLKQAREQKTDGIVLDLSNNGGGSLDDAVRIAGLFFKTGNVVKQSSKTEGREQILEDEDAMVDWSGPLVVLTSRISASASEIVSGTLQDYKRAIIVGGDHTFGKGSVQSVLPIPGDLGAIKVTVGMFFIPGGNSTQHRGVDADVILPGPYSTDDIGEKSLDYSLPPKKIDAFISKAAYVTDGAEAWKEVKADWVKALKEKSQVRVEKNTEFKKIIEDLKKSKDKGKVIKVADILKDKDKNEKEKKKKKFSKDEKTKEYLKRQDIQEASQVLLDLIQLQTDKLLTQK